MRRLDLSSNRIEGELPECDAPQLEELLLDDNNLGRIDELVRSRHLVPSLRNLSFRRNSKLNSKGEGLLFERSTVSLRFINDEKTCAVKHSFNCD